MDNKTKEMTKQQMSEKILELEGRISQLESEINHGKGGITPRRCGLQLSELGK